MIKILELFAGIGACSKALSNLEIEHEIVDAVEIDKYAIRSFNAIHGTNFEPQDITKWDKDLEADLIMHGSPCQDFSIAGRQAGGDEGTGTRSSLMYESLRIIEKVRPKYVIWENVKNLLSDKHLHNFMSYIHAMEKLGYKNRYKVLNAKNYGVPQNRERVFTISILDEPIIYDNYNQRIRADQETVGTLTTNCRNDVIRNGRKIIEPNADFEFPEAIPLEKKLKDLLEKTVDEKYYLSDKAVQGYLAHNAEHEKRGNGFKFEPTKGEGTAHCVSTKAGSRPTDNFVKVIGRLDIKGHDQVKRVYDKEGCSPTLSTMQGGNRQPKIIVSHGHAKHNKQHLGLKQNNGSDSSRNVQKDDYVAIKTANKKGYDLATDGDGIDLAYPNSTTRRGRVGHEVAKTLPTNDSQGVLNGLCIRKLTPVECWRLMGFDDEDYKKAKATGMSDTQLYKQAGNSIVVDVLMAVLKNLL